MWIPCEQHSGEPCQRDGKHEEHEHGVPDEEPHANKHYEPCVAPHDAVFDWEELDLEPIEEGEVGYHEVGTMLWDDQEPIFNIWLQR